MHGYNMYSDCRDGLASPSATFILESVVRGHQIYKRIWTPVLG